MHHFYRLPRVYEWEANGRELSSFVPSYRLSWLPVRRSGTKFSAKEMDLRWISSSTISPIPLEVKKFIRVKAPKNVEMHEEHRDIRSLPDFNLSVIRMREHKNHIIGNSLITINAMRIRCGQCISSPSPFSLLSLPSYLIARFPTKNMAQILITYPRG